MIQFKNYTYTYGNSNEAALQNIPMRVHPGEFLLITGKSGCGKSTLSKVILGFIRIFFQEIYAGGLSLRDKKLPNSTFIRLAEWLVQFFKIRALSFLPPIRLMKWLSAARIWGCRARTFCNVCSQHSPAWALRVYKIKASSKFPAARSKRLRYPPAAPWGRAFFSLTNLRPIWIWNPLFILPPFLGS